MIGPEALDYSHFEAAAKKKKDKGKAQDWNRKRAGTSKAKTGTSNALKRPQMH